MADGSCEFTSCVGCSGSPITGLFVSGIIDDRAVANFDNMNTYDASGAQICRVDQIRIRYREEDLNLDGYITISDLLLILSEFGCTSSCSNDVNQDGYVTVDDLLLILSVFGNTCESVFSACGDLVSHDGYDYSTVLIGDQCWFAENCRYLPVVSPSSEGSETDPYYYVYGYEGTDVTAAKSTD